MPLTIQCTPFPCKAEPEDYLNNSATAYVADIRQQLNKGNEWAWCNVEVRAFSSEYPTIMSEVWSCHCTYDGLEEFQRSESYTELRKAAIDALRQQLTGALAKVADALGDCHKG
jgi:hypothetical protein